MKFEYRLSKYDPAKRDISGAFTGQDWVMHSQIGSEIGGRVLTRDEYQRVEDAYVETVTRMLSEAGLQKVGVDKFRQFGKPVRGIKAFRKGQKIDLDTLSRVMRMSLQEQVEVSFSLPRQMYLHFGFDFLVYIGLAKPTPLANSFASKRGLFLEEMPSPYRRRSARR
jgi:hypothetical protein